MAGFFDDAEIGVPCPACGQETKQRIGWLKTHNQMACAGCGETIDLADAGFREGLARAERAISDFSKGLK